MFQHLQYALIKALGSFFDSERLLCDIIITEEFLENVSFTSHCVATWSDCGLGIVIEHL